MEDKKQHFNMMLPLFHHGGVNWNSYSGRVPTTTGEHHMAHRTYLWKKKESSLSNEEKNLDSWELSCKIASKLYYSFFHLYLGQVVF